MPVALTFKCTLCNVVCFSQESFDQHNIDQHSGANVQRQNPRGVSKKSDPLDVVCRVCFQTFTSATQLVQHKLVTGHVSVAVLNPSQPQSTPANSDGQQNTRCEDCNIDCVTAANLQSHLNGARHRQTMNSLRPKTRCEDCDIDCVNVANLQSHLKGARHRKNLRTLKNSEAVVESRNHSTDTWCAVCEIDCGSAHNLRVHLNGSRHRRMLEQNRGANVALSNDPTREERCDLCDINCGSFENLQLHLGGSKHKRKVELSKAFCRICNLQCQSFVSYHEHIAGSKHEKRLRNLEIDVSETEPYEDAPDVVDATDEPSKPKFWCEPCQLDLRNAHNWELHINGAKHARNAKRAKQRPPSSLPPPPPCTQCGVSFKTVEERARHMKSAEHKNAHARVNEIMEKAFNSLETMNEWLVNLGEEPESSKTKAKAALRAIHINIFDLANRRFDKRHKDLRALRRYTRKYHLFYDKEEAKGTDFKHFLRHLKFSN